MLMSKTFNTINILHRITQDKFVFSEFCDVPETLSECRNVLLEQRRMNKVNVLVLVTYFCSGIVLHTRYIHLVEGSWMRADLLSEEGSDLGGSILMSGSHSPGGRTMTSSRNSSIPASRSCLFFAL